MNALHDVAVAAGGRAGQAELAELVAARAQTIAGADAAVLRWFDPDSSTFRLLASAGTLELPAAEIASEMPTAIREAFNSGRPVIVNDYEASGQTTSWGRSQGIAAQLAVPLMVEGKAMGTLAVLSFRRRRYLSGEARFLSMLAALVAPALEAARLAKQMKATEDLFSAAFQASAVGMALTEIDGAVIRANPALCLMLGFSECDLVGRPALELVDANDFELAHNALAGLYARSDPRTVTTDLRVVRKDGLALWTRVTASLIAVDGQPRHVLLHVVDMSEERRAQSILQAEHQRLGVIIEAQREIAASDFDVDRLLNVLSERAVTLAGSGSCTVMLPEGKELVARASVGEPSVPVGFRLPIDGSIAGIAYRTGEVQRVSDAQHDKRAHAATARAKGIGAMVSAPLVDDGHAIGVLQLVSAQPGGLDETDARTLEMLAGFAAAAFQRATGIRKLQASERRVRAVMDAAPDPIIVFNAAGKIVDLNPAAQRSFLRTREEAVGQTAMLLLAPKHMEAFQRWNQAGSDANSAEYAGRLFEATGRRSDGTEFPIEIVITDLPEDTRLAAAFLRDLTLRDRLKESRERLAAVVASAPVIVLACQTNGTITLAEGSGLSVLGRTPQDVLGRNIRELAAGDADAAALIDRLLAGTSESGRLHVAESDTYLGSVASRITAADGALSGVSVVMSDVTARVRAEEAQRQSETKSRVMAMMNHEVRTPLNSILGFTHLLKDPQYGELNEKQRRYVGNIESSGNHLLEMINESLDLTSLDIGRVNIDLQEVLLHQCMEQAAEQVELLADARELELRVVGCGEVKGVADRRQLVQVILNLLSNAIRHTHKGGSVVLSCGRDGDHAVVRVVDTGDGIAKADQARLFEEFFQASNHAPGGVGLGLAISRRLAERMGGAIQVESELGMGSTFTVRLQMPPSG